CHLEQRPVKLKNKFLEKRALKKADGIISVSAFTGNLTDKLMGLQRNFVVIPNSIDVSYFQPKNSESEKLTILYFGTLIRKKGLLELPEIFNLVYEINKEVKLILVGKDSGDIKTGTNSTWQLMQPLFDESAIKKVTYLGGVDYSKIQELIHEATVNLLPTLAHT